MAILVSSIEQLEREFPKGEHLPKIIEYLRTLSEPEKIRQLRSLKDGESHEENLVGGGFDKKIYVVELKMATRPIEDRFYEAHRKFLDIQVMVSGEEEIRVTSLDGLEVLREGENRYVPFWGGVYDNERDIMLYSNKKKGSSLIMEPGRIAVFFPEDAHMTLGRGSDSIIKVVIKYSVDLLKH